MKKKIKMGKPLFPICENHMLIQAALLHRLIGVFIFRRQDEMISLVSISKFKSLTIFFGYRKVVCVLYLVV